MIKIQFCSCHAVNNQASWFLWFNRWFWILLIRNIRGNNQFEIWGTDYHWRRMYFIKLVIQDFFNFPLFCPSYHMSRTVRLKLIRSWIFRLDRVRELWILWSWLEWWNFLSFQFRTFSFIYSYLQKFCSSWKRKCFKSLELLRMSHEISLRFVAVE